MCFRMFLIFVVLYLYCSSSILSMEFSGYYEWSPSHATRTDLFCPNCCKSKDEDGNSATSEVGCCSCKAKAFWERPLNSSLLSSLPIEYLNRRGQSTIVNVAEQHNLVHEVKQIRGFMTRLPENLCNISKLVKIDFSENKIQSIDRISCSAELNTIILKKNAICLIRNGTFSGMMYLRLIDLSDNSLVKLEPFSLSLPELGLTHIYVQNNYMESIDVTNIALPGPFCNIDASNNSIKSIVNEAGFVMNDSLIYGDGGMVHLSDNKFQTWPDFTKLGLKDIKQMGKLLSFGFDLRGAEWNCNADMVPFLQLAKPIIDKIWRGYFDVKCYSPERLRGESIPQLVNDSRLNEFTSNLSLEDGCPFNCTCIYHPVINTTEVDCSSLLLLHKPEEMPNEMPKRGYLNINFSQTSFKNFSRNEYNHRIQHVDFQYSKVSVISNDAIAQFNSNMIEIDLSNTSNMIRITKHFRKLDPCKIHFGVKTIKCTCEDVWIQNWLDIRDCTSGNVLTCETSKGLVPLLRLSEFLLCEEINTLYRLLSIIFALFLLVLTLAVSLVYFYRYEILILLKRHKTGNEIDWNKYKYDAYISMHDSNPHLRDWIIHVLLPELGVAGYKIHCPLVNAEFGRPIDEEIIDKLSTSRNFLIFLSQEYIGNLEDEEYENTKTRLEWKYAWNFFKKNQDRRMIILNFDQIRLADVTWRQLRAFLRLRKTLDFSNRNHMLLHEIKELLGSPKRQYRGLGCNKPAFMKDSIFAENEECYELRFDLGKPLQDEYKCFSQKANKYVVKE